MSKSKSVTWEAWANYGPISDKIGIYKTLREAWAALMNSIVAGQQGIVTDGQNRFPFNREVKSLTSHLPILIQPDDGRRQYFIGYVFHSSYPLKLSA